MRIVHFLSVLVLAAIGSGCAHSMDPIDLRICPAAAPQSGQPVYIREISIKDTHVRPMLPEGRTPVDVVREALTDQLHKKGYVVQSQPTPGSIELDAEILRFGIKKESGRKPPNQVLSAIAIMGMSVLEGSEVQYTSFPIEVLMKGAIFKESEYGFAGSKVYLLKNEDYPQFANKGLAKFSDALSWKIAQRDGGMAAPTRNRRQAKEREATEKHADRIEKEAAERDRLRAGAAQGKAEDQYGLARVLARGSRYELVGADKPASEKWMRAAAAQGHGAALWSLFSAKARPHSESQASEQNLEEAETFLRKAALHGNINAQVFLGSMFYEGLNNPAEGQTLFTIWTNQRDSLRFSKRFQHDNARAYAWMSIAASHSESAESDASRPPAINTLALRYREALKASMPQAEVARGEQLAKEYSAQNP
jgi:TPR repeat protein